MEKGVGDRAGADVRAEGNGGLRVGGGELWRMVAERRSSRLLR